MRTAKHFHSGKVWAQRTATICAISSNWSVKVNWTRLSSRSRPYLLLLSILKSKCQWPEPNLMSLNSITRKRQILVHWICNLSYRQLNLLVKACFPPLNRELKKTFPVSNQKYNSIKKKTFRESRNLIIFKNWSKKAKRLLGACAVNFLRGTSLSETSEASIVT